MFGNTALLLCSNQDIFLILMSLSGGLFQSLAALSNTAIPLEIVGRWVKNGRVFKWVLLIAEGCGNHLHQDWMFSLWHLCVLCCPMVPTSVPRGWWVKCCISPWACDPNIVRHWRNSWIKWGTVVFGATSNCLPLGFTPCLPKIHKFIACSAQNDRDTLCTDSRVRKIWPSPVGQVIATAAVPTVKVCNSGTGCQTY